MNEKVLFESKGLSKIVESRYYYVAIILALISFLILYFTHIHVLDLKDNQAGLLFFDFVSFGCVYNKNYKNNQKM